VSEHEPVEVPAALDGERVDRAVALLTGWSRSDVQALLAEGGVLVDGRAVGKSRRLHAGEIVEVQGEPVPDAPPVAEPGVEVVVRYEDDDVIVVAKPAGLVVHPGAGHSSGTLVHGLLARYPEIADVGDPFRPGIVHRLDRDTSGLMVVARTPRAYDALVEQLSARAVDRRYSTLVWGRPAATRGTIDAPIGRSSARRTRMAVRDAGRPARTGYEVERTFDEPRCSLLACTLETGRTHQIRVHLAAIGHPVVGDATYGGHRESIDLDRPFLHAEHLAFTQPATGARVEFTEPLPPELAAVLARWPAEA
jgi:23S rRNA pseudouridine1911/1915/1917 synthase